MSEIERADQSHSHIPAKSNLKTEGLKQALDKYGVDAAFGGARRDEEKSRAKERIFSFRSASHGWDPKNQRPELWNLYNRNGGCHAQDRRERGVRAIRLADLPSPRCTWYDFPAQHA